VEHKQITVVGMGWGAALANSPSSVEEKAYLVPDIPSREQVGIMQVLPRIFAVSNDYMNLLPLDSSSVHYFAIVFFLRAWSFILHS